MNELDLVYLIAAAMGVGFTIGGCLASPIRTYKDAADAAVSDDPPSWWKQELIKARARKDVAAERAKEKR